MKKILMLALAAILSFGNLCYAAENESTLSVQRDGQTISIESTGNPTYTYASIKVTDCNDNTDFFDIVKTDSEGYFKVVYFCEADSGTCTVNVNVGDEVMLKTEFEFLNNKDLLVLAGLLNEAIDNKDVDEIKKIIIDNADGLSLSMTMYDGLDNKDLVFDIIAEAGKKVNTPSDIAELFYDAVINASIKSGMTSETLKSMLEDNDFANLLGIDEIMPKYENGNNVYNELTDEYKLKVCEKTLAKNITSVDMLKETIVFSTLKVGLKEFVNASNAEMLLRAYNAAGKISVSFKKYDALSDSLAAMKNVMGKDYGSYAEVERAFSSAVAANTKDSGSSGGSSGGGSGKGSSIVSAGTSVNPDIFTPIKTNGTDIFSDMTDAKWAEAAVNALYGMNAINGVGDGKFAPNRKITRNEAAKFIAWFFGEKANVTNPFDDVSETHWSYPYVMSAYGNGIVNGKSENIFAGEDNVTREEMAVMIYRTLNALKKEVIAKTVSGELKDIDTYPEWSAEAINELYSYGIVRGDQNSKFNPKNDVTRAEAAQMIFNLTEVLGITEGK